MKQLLQCLLKCK